MSMDDRLTRAAHHLADGLTPPEVDLVAVRRRAKANQRRTTALVVSAAVVGVIAATTAIGIGREVSAPPAPGGPRPSESVEPGFQGTGTCDPVDYEQPEPTFTSVDDGLQEWVDGLTEGSPPVSPWWHDGVLHVGGIEIEAPYDTVRIEAAGGTILVGGGYDKDLKNATPSEWSVVRGDTLERLPAPDRTYVTLSPGGRIAWWQLSEEAGYTTRYVVWDTETSTELASRTVEASGPDFMCARVLLGIDDDGIGYLLNETNDPPITRWDVRADTIEPTDLTYDRTSSFVDQYDFSWWATQGFTAAYVSPDGAREVFTGPAAGDADPECCRTLLRVRPVGSTEPDEVVTLPLPPGIPSMSLWDEYSDRGTWGAWWETDETVLIDAEVGDHSYLVRCFADGGSCELVFDLGKNHSAEILYEPDWEREWGFARLP